MTHRPPASLREASVYLYAPNLEVAIETATQAAAGRDVAVMGGASLIQQVLSGNLVDSLQLHVAPVIFGSGLRLFENLEEQPRNLTLSSAVATASAMHLLYTIERS
ncbi:dihydrofolate reductase family protein [Sphingosinicella sp. CPCC 101087]|uniref:dihydrofolate reductase family protein n=1 Tax=Sphingosinicella sp. CPCC 101087 TaxID=2497754 RepID=UPI0013EDC355|nr:dihydrofolate reductase family protein [Sphingosinicella sp. CPCC 101087]